MDHVIGYTVAHDVSARDWQMKRNGGQWLIGKTMDTFCPLGPAIVTKDELSGKKSQENNHPSLQFAEFLTMLQIYRFMPCF